MMETLYIIPNWFSTIDGILEIIFALITALVAYKAYKIYKLTDDHEIRFFGISFTLLSISYILRLWQNAFFTISEQASTNFFVIEHTSFWGVIAITSYALCFVSAYVTLAYASLQVSGRRSYLLLLLPSVVALFFSENPSFTLFLLTSIFLIAVVYHHMYLYLKTSQKRRISMLIALIFLLISNVFYIFIQDYNFYQGYLISSVSELIAYILIALTLYGNIKHKN